MTRCVGEDCGEDGERSLLEACCARGRPETCVGHESGKACMLGDCDACMLGDCDACMLGDCDACGVCASAGALVGSGALCGASSAASGMSLGVPLHDQIMYVCTHTYACVWYT